MSLWTETATSKIVHPHLLQMIVLLAKQREIAVVAGQGSGKTSLIPVWIAMDMVDRKWGEYLLTEPTFDMVERIMIPTVIDFFKGTELEGEWISKKHRIYGNEFGRIYFSSTDNPEHIQGSHVHRAVMDEAGQSPYIAYQMVKNRTNLYNGQLLLMSNPYRKGDSWLYTDFKRRFDEGDPDVLFLTMPSIWNPAFDRQRFKKDMETMRPEDFAFYYLGIYTKPEGLVFNYDRDVVAKDLKWDGQSVCYAGADFGVGDPTVLEVAFVNSTGIHFIDEYYKQDPDLEVHAKGFADLVEKYKIKKIFYDPSGLVYQRQIEKYFKEWGIKVEWVRGENDNTMGVETLVKLFRQGKITISPKCYRMLDEDMGYIWKKDGTLPDGNDHAITARKYLVLTLSNQLKREYKPAPKVEAKAMNWIEEHFKGLYEKVINPKIKPDLDWRDIF
jgi:hypothetical protein